MRNLITHKVLFTLLLLFSAGDCSTFCQSFQIFKQRCLTSIESLKEKIFNPPPILPDVAEDEAEQLANIYGRNDDSNDIDNDTVFEEEQRRISNINYSPINEEELRTRNNNSPVKIARTPDSKSKYPRQGSIGADDVPGSPLIYAISTFNSANNSGEKNRHVAENKFKDNIKKNLFDAEKTNQKSSPINPNINKENALDILEIQINEENLKKDKEKEEEFMKSKQIKIEMQETLKKDIPESVPAAHERETESGLAVKKSCSDNAEKRSSDPYDEDHADICKDQDPGQDASDAVILPLNSLKKSVMKKSTINKNELKENITVGINEELCITKFTSIEKWKKTMNVKIFVKAREIIIDIIFPNHINIDPKKNVWNENELSISLFVFFFIFPETLDIFISPSVCKFYLQNVQKNHRMITNQETLKSDLPILSNHLTDYQVVFQNGYVISFTINLGPNKASLQFKSPYLQNFQKFYQMITGNKAILSILSGKPDTFIPGFIKLYLPNVQKNYGMITNQETLKSDVPILSNHLTGYQVDFQNCDLISFTINLGPNKASLKFKLPYLQNFQQFHQMITNKAILSILSGKPDTFIPGFTKLYREYLQNFQKSDDLIIDQKSLDTTKNMEIVELPFNGENSKKDEEKEEEIKQLKQRKSELQEQLEKNRQTKAEFDKCSTDLVEKKSFLSAKEIEIKNVITIVNAFNENMNVEDLKSTNDSCANFSDQWKEMSTNDDLNINFKQNDIDKCFKHSVHNLQLKGENEAIAARDKIKNKLTELSEKQMFTEFALIGVSISQMMLIGVGLFLGLDCKNKKKKKKKKKNRSQTPKKKQNLNVKMNDVSPSPAVNSSSPSTANTSDSGVTLSTTYDYGPVGSYDSFLQNRSMSNPYKPYNPFHFAEYEIKKNEKKQQNFETFKSENSL